MKSLLRLCAVLLALTGVARAATIDPALIEAAKKEGSVVWYSGMIINQIIRPIAEAFEAKYPGIKVQYSRAAGSDNALKIMNEARARRPLADMVDGSTAFNALFCFCIKIGRKLCKGSEFTELSE